MRRHRIIAAAAMAAAAVATGVLATAHLHAGAAGNNPFESFVYDNREHTTAAIPAIGGGSTTVTVDANAAKLFGIYGFQVAPVAPATAGSNGGTLTFPVTGGEAFIFPKHDLPFIRGDVVHSGGLSFSAGATTVTATDFIINPGTSILTAKVGDKDIPLFELDGSGVKVGHDSAGNPTLDGTVVKISQEAADALNAAFGISLFREGLTVGTAHIVLMPAK
ncbi:MAG TPA: hypothetical protein VF155_08685 [Candidatus Dormibacteraeota bacterium]